MKNLIFASALLVSICSCKKEFKHIYPSELTETKPCDLCSYANTLEGSYRGKWQSQNPQITDSVTAHLEHIFLGLGNSLDSSQLFFKLTKDFDNHPTVVDTISLDNSSGIFYITDYEDTLRIGSDSVMRIHHWFTSSFGFYQEIVFNGYKQ